MNVAKLALEPLARLLRREQQNNKEVHLVVDDGAQEVLRWSGGVEGAVADLGVASVRALPAAGEPCPCDGSVVVVALCDAFDAKRCAAFAAAARAVVAASSAADAAAARDRFAGDGSVVVEEAPLLFSAPFGGGDDALPQFFALADATSARCFPVLPWDVAACVQINQTSEFSSSVKSKSIRLIFGRIDCSQRVLEARRKCSCQTVRLRAH